MNEFYLKPSLLEETYKNFSDYENAIDRIIDARAKKYTIFIDEAGAVSLPGLYWRSIEFLKGTFGCFGLQNPTEIQKIDRNIQALAQFGKNQWKNHPEILKKIEIATLKTNICPTIAHFSPCPVPKENLSPIEKQPVKYTALKLRSVVLAILGFAVFSKWAEDIYQGNIQLEQKIALVALTTWTAYNSFKDLTKKKWNRGIPKLLLCTVLAGLTYYAFSRQPQFYNSFVRKHRADIKLMMRTKYPIKNWCKLGNGVSKITLAHPDLPGHVMKIPNRDGGFWASRGKTTENSDIRLHFQHAHEARKIIKSAGLNRLFIPNSYLVETFSGPILIEERLNIENTVDWDELIPFFGDKEKKIAREQLSYLEEKAKICDLALFMAHNVAFLQNKKEIGIFDMDCKKK